MLSILPDIYVVWEGANNFWKTVKFVLRHFCTNTQ